MDQSLVHTFSWGNSSGPMVLKVLLKFPPTLALVHGWLFPEKVSKTSSGLLERSVNKVSQKRQRTRKGTKKVSKSVFGDSF